MAKRKGSGQRIGQFSNAGNRFDVRPKPVRQNNEKPLSPALKRGVTRCARCGSRVVSNARHCYFCGRSLKPIYARFWFWLIVLVVVAAVVISFIKVSLPEESTTPSGPVEPERPQVLNGTEDSSLKNLALNTTIDNSGLEVTVLSVSEGPLTAKGAQIYVVEVEFTNKNDETLTLYSTQWMLETSDGQRLDTFVGSAADGATLSSNFEVYELEAQGRFSGRLFFAVTQPAEEENPEQILVTPFAMVYQPSALAYKEELLVTWTLS